MIIQKILLSLIMCLLVSCAMHKIKQDPAQTFPLALPEEVVVRPLLERPTILPKYSEQDLQCMTMNLYREATTKAQFRKDDMLAIGQVVLNRIEDKRYPDTVCDVVYQRKQFSWTNSKRLRTVNLPKLNKLEQEAYAQAEAVALEILSGEYVAPVADATHYHADYVKPRWTKKMSRLAKVGVHIYYKD